MSVATTSKVFLGSIPHTVSEEELKEEVSQYGTVDQFYYMRDQRQQTKGWAFVTYAAREEAIRAINEMDTKLKFPGSETAVEARFANKKAPGDAMVTPRPMMQQRMPTCWQQYYTPEGHPYYYNAITDQTQWERPMMETQVPMPRHDGGSPGFPPRSNLFIFHIPNDWTESDLSQRFQHFGNIVSCRLQKDSTGRNRGFGFVSFDNPISADNARKGMNGFFVNGKYLKVDFKRGEGGESFGPGAMHHGPSMAPSYQHGMGMRPASSTRYAPY